MTKNYYPLYMALLMCLSLHAQENETPYAARLVSTAKAGQNNFAPFRYGDKIYFTSEQEERGKSVNRLYNAEYNKQGFQPLPINPKKSSLHASNLTMTPDNKVVYYTLCQDQSQDQCTIWSRKKLYDGNWTAAEKLPAHINLRSYTTTQPSIGYDWGLKKNVLYFVSDRPGGKGGKDIWQTVIELDGTYGKPTPLAINTELDEVTPFFQLSEQVLFFSSNGYTGFGGFDIFSSKKLKSGEWTFVENKGSTINTPSDETYFMYHSNLQKAYFTSNKQGGQHAIYETDVIVELAIPVVSSKNLEVLNGMTAYIYDQTTDQKFVYQDQPFDHHLHIYLLPERIYKVVVIKKGFEPSEMELSTEGVVLPQYIVQEMQLFEDEEIDMQSEKRLNVSLIEEGHETKNTKSIGME